MCKRTYCDAATGVEQEVCRVGGYRGLVGDWPVAERHANDGGHVSLCAEDVNGDAGSLACEQGENFQGQQAQGMEGKAYSQLR